MTIFVGDLIYTRALEDGWKESAIVIWRGRKNIKHEHFRSISFNTVRRPSVQPITFAHKFHSPIYRALSFLITVLHSLRSIWNPIRERICLFGFVISPPPCVYGLNEWKKFIDTLYCNLKGELVQSTAVVWILCACCS